MSSIPFSLEQAVCETPVLTNISFDLRSPHGFSLTSPGAKSLSMLDTDSPGLTALDPAFGPLVTLEHSSDEDTDSDVEAPMPDPRAATPTPATVDLPPRAIDRASAAFDVREATVDDAVAIKSLTDRVNMDNATSFVWPLDELVERIKTRTPLTVVACPVEDPTAVIGVAGIDIYGMEKGFDVLSIGSRFSQAERGAVFTIPSSYCMCRGLLIDPQYQGRGLGSLLHKTRVNLLRELAPDTPSVVLSARGSSYEEARATLGKVFASSRMNITPAFTKENLFEFTFPTSTGIVHMSHGREDGWKFVGVDVSDGGPVWCTTVDLADLTRTYSHLGLSHFNSVRLWK